MVLLGSNDPTWAAAVSSTTKVWGDAGGSASSVLYPPGTSDLSGYLAKVKSQDPDVLYIGENPQSVTLALQQLDAAGIGKDVIVVGHGTEASVGAQAGGRPYLAAPFSPGPLSGEGTNAGTTALVGKYFAASKTTKLPAYSPPIRYYYDIMYVLAASMTKAGSVDDTKAILAQVVGKNLGYTGALGSVSFTADGFIRFPLVSTFVAANGTQTATTWQPGT
jgi:ABC-type branched-subunit amino acid transport system substrate-binding protein